MRASTARQNVLRFIDRQVLELSTFELVRVVDVIKMVGSASDRLLTWPLKDSIAILTRSSRPCSTHR